MTRATDAVATPLAEYVMRHTSGWGSDEVHGLSVEPKAALLEYLELFYHLGRAG